MNKEKKILIIEDDLPIIKLFKEVFVMAGLEIEILDSGKKVMERIEDIKQGKKEKPALVLLDLILPDINGLELLKEFRKYPETKDTKIYALTNYSNPDTNEELKKEGIDRILIKAQYSLKELTEIIKEAIR